MNNLYKLALASIEQAQAAEQAATPGPWVFMDDNDDFTGWYVESKGHPKGHQLIVFKSEMYDTPEGYADCALAAAARNAYPAFLADCHARLLETRTAWASADSKQAEQRRICRLLIEAGIATPELIAAMEEHHGAG